MVEKSGSGGWSGEIATLLTGFPAQRGIFLSLFRGEKNLDNTKVGGKVGS